MTEIRPIHESEGENFLQFLCDVFKLDFNRAYDIFFQEPLFDLSRKWALFEGQEMVSVLTTTPLKFGWGDAIGIAGVATSESRRNEGHAGRLIQKVIKEYGRRGEEGVLLFAHEPSLYERLGFEALDRVIRGTINHEETSTQPKTLLTFEQIRETYDRWSYGHPDRLRRDSKRWNYWQWHNRRAMEFSGGYLTSDQGVVREAIFGPVQPALPVPQGTEWTGLTFVTDQLEIPLTELKVEMYLMGYNVPGQPQLFLTDQF